MEFGAPVVLCGLFLYWDNCRRNFGDRLQNQFLWLDDVAMASDRGNDLFIFLATSSICGCCPGGRNDIGMV